MLKEMEDKLEEVQNELFEKEKDWSGKYKTSQTTEKQLKSDLHEATTDMEKFKGLYESSVKNIQNFKS
jgi:hypothetical protein